MMMAPIWGWGQGSEDFTNLPTNSSTSYNSRSWTGTNGVTWTAEGARTDQTMTGKAICWGTSGTRNVISPSYSGGMGNLTFKYVRAFTGTGVRSLEVYVNSVMIGSTITVNSNSDLVVTYSSDINVSGNVVLEIRSTGASQVKVDDIVWTGYAASPPTKLSITSITPTSPAAGSSFNVTVQAQDGSNIPSAVTSATEISLNKASGTGTLGGTTTGTIANGANSVIISGVTFDTPGAGVSITATPTTGMTGLTPATSGAFTVLSTQPTPASVVTITSRTNNSIGLSWTNGNGTGRIVVARLNATTAVAPTPGTAYTANSASFVDGANSTTGTGNVVVYNGTGNSVTITGLTAATAYNFEVYGYNGTAPTINYAAGASAGSTSTLAAEPTAQPTNLTFTNVTATGMTIGWTSGDGTNRIVLVKATSAVDGTPVDGTAYTANTTFGSGAQIGTLNYVVYNGTGNSVTITGLTSNTTYYVAISGFNGSATTINYLTTSPLTGNRITIPTVATAVTVASRTATSMDLSWTNGNGTGRILVARATSSTLVAPTYGTSYTVNSNNITDPLNGSTGTGNIVVYNGTGNSTSVTGLSPATQYQFYVYEYNTSSNYAAAASSSATYTFPTEPTTQASALSFSGILSTAFTVDFTKGDGAYRVILVKAGSAVDGIPVDGTSYLTAAYGSGTQIGTGNYVVYSGTAGSATITGLSPNTTYYVGIFEFNGTGGNSNYLTTAPATGNQITLVAAPSAPTNLTFASVTYNSFNASFTAPGTAPSGYLVLRRKGDVISGTPVGGTVYTAGESIGAAANEIIYVGTSAWSAYAQAGLDDGTTYYYDVYSYNGTETQTSYSLTALSGSQTTSAVPAPNATAATAVTSTGFTANWDEVTGATDGYLLDVSNYLAFGVPGESVTLTEGFNNGTTVPTGWTFTAIGGTYTTATNYGTSSPSLKLDATDDRVQTPTLSGAATSLSFWIKGQGATGSYILVEGFNGSVWSTIQNILLTSITTGTTKTYTSATSPALPSNMVQFRFTYTQSSGNLAFDDVSIIYSPFTPSFVSGYNAKPISGQATVTSEVTGLTPNTPYYYRVRAVGPNSTSANSNVIEVTTLAPPPATSTYSNTGIWTNATNWSNGLPDEFTDAIINGNVIVDDASECNNLTISSAGTLTVVPDAVLDVNGDLLIQSDGTGTGSFIGDAADYLIGGTTTVQRYLTGGWDEWNTGWHQLSSPVAAQPIADFATGNYDFYGWEESTNMWMNYKDAGFEAWNGGTNFNVGQGYLVSYEAANTTQTFTGLLNTADVLQSNLSTNGGSDDGWHLLGNPFASALTWNDGTKWALSNVAGNAKIWHEANKSYSDIAANGIIPSAQGFMVQVINASNSITIPADSRVHNATPFFKSRNEQLLLVATETEGGSAQESKIMVNPMATEGFDFDYDSRFLAGYAPTFYSVAGDELLSTNSFPSIDAGLVIPFGFVKNAASSFSIQLKESMEGRVVYLTDTKTGTVSNLTETPVYSFTSSDGDDANRFLLSFGTLGINNPEATDGVQVYAFGEVLYIGMSSKEAAQVNVYNLTGQLVMQGRTGGNTLSTFNTSALGTGIYVVNVVMGNQVISRKVAIRN